MQELQEKATGETSPEAQAPPQLPSYLNPARIEILAWMRRNGDGPIADLYEGCIRMISDPSFPGRVRFVSHGVREIRNRLPDFISGKKGAARFDYQGQLDEIVEAWEKMGLSLDGSIPVSAAEQENGSRAPSNPMPEPVFRMIEDLLKTHVGRRPQITLGGKQIRNNDIEPAIRLFEACAPENKNVLDTLAPAIRQWVNVSKWFVKKTHQPAEALINFSEKELQAKFELFETCLTGMARGFFAVLDELDEILEDTNS
jgi:hypothetical protein